MSSNALQEPTGWPEDARRDRLIGDWYIYQRTGGHRTSTDTAHNTDDPDYDILQDNLAVLKNSTDAAGRTLDIGEVEQAPGALWHQPRTVEFATNRLCGSYINFYFSNGAVIIPGLDNEEFDQKARMVFEQTFPDRDVVQVPSLFLYARGGNIHCITQQQPKV